MSDQNGTPAAEVSSDQADQAEPQEPIAYMFGRLGVCYTQLLEEQRVGNQALAAILEAMHADGRGVAAWLEKTESMMKTFIGGMADMHANNTRLIELVLKLGKQQRWLCKEVRALLDYKERGFE